MITGDRREQRLPIAWTEALERIVKVRQEAEGDMIRHPILCVEDDENEVALLRHVLKEAGICNPLHVVAGGQQAITYLAGASLLRNGEADLFPCLVLLDLHLPDVPGLKVLEWIRAQPPLTTLVVIVLSSSEDPQELARAYRLRANSFILKPADLGQYLEFARLLKGWWLERNQVPEPDERHFRADGPREPVPCRALPLTNAL